MKFLQSRNFFGPYFKEFNINLIFAMFLSNDKKVQGLQKQVRGTQFGHAWYISIEHSINFLRLCTPTFSASPSFVSLEFCFHFRAKEEYWIKFYAPFLQQILRWIYFQVGMYIMAKKMVLPLLNRWAYDLF